MNSDKILRDLNQQVYLVDPAYKGGKYVTYVAKSDNQLKSREENTLKLSGGQEFRVISVENGKWGFQGMAVAPVKGGHVDYSQVTVVAAGTDPSQPIDLLEALDAVTDIGSLQESSAEQFVKDIMENHPNWKITQLSGYSQSAYMLKVGAKFHIPTTVFNGWFQYGSLSKREKEFMKSHSDWFINYRRKNDNVTVWNDFNSEFFNSEDYGTIVWLDGDSHDLADWKFDKDGMVKLPKSSAMTAARIKQSQSLLNVRFSQAMFQLEYLRTNFLEGGGGLSSSEEIYLDSAQALAIVSTARAEFNLALSKVMKLYQDGIKQVEEHWQETLSEAMSIGNQLDKWEVYEALEEAGFTHEAIVGTPTQIYQHKISQVKRTSEKFENLENKIKAKISEVVSRDQELAQELKSL
ncbi:hypothetical protein GHK52_04770 [Lactococcus garvieae]|nr:hypothetical protein [Lactococcus garvieae]